MCTCVSAVCPGQGGVGSLASVARNITDGVEGDDAAPGNVRPPPSLLPGSAVRVHLFFSYH
jgi:hypothetical protein